MLPPPQCRSRLARNLLLLFRLPRGTRLRWGHAPKPLGFDATKLTGLSERLIRSHWKSNYQGSIKALNMAGGALSNAMTGKVALRREAERLPFYL
jgi:fatty acid/phospholipid biosynthesis enzyme